MSHILEAPYIPKSFCPGMVRCAIYARYSCENSRQSSIEDQIRECREAAARKGWVVTDEYIFADQEKTGTTLHGRDGFQKLMLLGKSKPRLFDYIVVADTSRFGRNTADTLKSAEILMFWDVNLYFVEDELDSADPGFEDRFYDRARRDAAYSVSLGKKIKRGRRGRFLAGMNPGGYCYGYWNIPEEDPTQKGDYGRPKVIGVRQVVNPEEAAIIVRIFQTYLRGLSTRAIAVMLNEEGVPTSQAGKGGRKAFWCKSAIRVILENTRYIGQTIYGRITQTRDPESGKIITTTNPEHEWERKFLPELRIVSDELFLAVQEIFKKRSKTTSPQALGGMSRTEASRSYFLSGLLRCGVCGGPMCVVKGSPKARYGCSVHRQSKTCPNSRTIMRDALEEAFLHGLTANLRNADVADELARAVLASSLIALKRERQDDKTADEYEAALRKVKAQIANVMAAIRDAGHRRSLLTDLEDLEGQEQRITEALEGMRTTVATPEPTFEEVHSFVMSSMNNLRVLLEGDRVRLKAELQRVVSTITLTPRDLQAKRAVWEVAGGVGLFSRPEGTPQASSVDSIGQQCTFPIAFVIQTERRGEPAGLPPAA